MAAALFDGANDPPGQGGDYTAELDEAHDGPTMRRRGGARHTEFPDTAEGRRAYRHRLLQRAHRRPGEGFHIRLMRKLVLYGMLLLALVVFALWAYMWWALLGEENTFGPSFEYLFALISIIISFFFYDELRKIIPAITGSASRYRSMLFDIRALVSDLVVYTRNAAPHDPEIVALVRTLFSHAEVLLDVVYIIYGGGGNGHDLRDIARAHPTILRHATDETDPTEWATDFLGHLLYDVDNLQGMVNAVATHPLQVSASFSGTIARLRETLRQTDINTHCAPPPALHRYQIIVIVSYFALLPLVLVSRFGIMTVVYYPFVMAAMIGVLIIGRWANWQQSWRLIAPVPYYDLARWTAQTMHIIAQRREHFEARIAEGVPARQGLEAERQHDAEYAPIGNNDTRRWLARRGAGGAGVLTYPVAGGVP